MKKLEVIHKLTKFAKKLFKSECVVTFFSVVMLDKRLIEAFLL